jgi:Tat protein translocase TatB subunit
MEFFGVGPWELLLILIVALIIVGPSKLVEVARTLGKMVRAVRKASAELTTAVTRELEATKNIPTPPKAKEEQTSKAPLTISQAGTESQDNQPAESGEAPLTK